MCRAQARSALVLAPHLTAEAFQLTGAASVLDRRSVYIGEAVKGRSRRIKRKREEYLNFSAISAMIMFRCTIEIGSAGVLDEA